MSEKAVAGVELDGHAPSMLRVATAAWTGAATTGGAAGGGGVMGWTSRPVTPLMSGPFTKLNVTHIVDPEPIVPMATRLKSPRTLSRWVGDAMKASWRETTLPPRPTFSPILVQWRVTRLSTCARRSGRWDRVFEDAIAPDHSRATGMSASSRFSGWRPWSPRSRLSRWRNSRSGSADADAAGAPVTRRAAATASASTALRTVRAVLAVRRCVGEELIA